MTTMMNDVRVQSLGSGSSGNLLVIESNDGLALVDCGFGPRRLVSALTAGGWALDDVRLIVLTHEHGDHACGLAAFRHLNVPVVCTDGTARATGTPPENRIELAARASTPVGGFSIAPYIVSHDAAEPSGYQIGVAGIHVAVLVDLGLPEDHLRSAIASSDLVVLEANHDVDLLRNGPYPSQLKRRVLSATGHLSNADCAELLVASLSGTGNKPTVWLAHLSETNNRPGLARTVIQQSLARADVAATVDVLPRRRPGPVWTPRHVRAPAIQMAMPGF